MIWDKELLSRMNARIDMLVTDEPLDKGDEETLEKAGVQVVYA